MIMIGADTHKATHTCAAVAAATGQLAGELTVAARKPGFIELLAWRRGLDGERVWAIEDCRHVSGALERFLVAAGERVVRVPPKLMGESRRGERSAGKSDPIDALAVARAALREGPETLPAAHLDEAALELKLLLDHREDIVKARSADQQRLHWHLHDLWPELELPAGCLDRPTRLDRLARKLARAEQSARVRVARELVVESDPQADDGDRRVDPPARVARESAVKSRSAAILQLGDLILTAPSELREQLASAKTLKGKAGLCRRLRPDLGRLQDPLNAAKLALRSLAGRIALLDEEIAELDGQLTPLVASAAPRTTSLLGVSTGHAGQLLLTAGQNIERLRSEAAFAALCGASPVPIASGKRGRYRLNYGGDRQANRALHMIAVCRLRYCSKTRAYVERRTGEGKTKKEIIRCLKRYIAREVHASLHEDLGSLSLST